MDKVQGLRYKRTLFVGLGGAGAKTLRSLKRKIIRANGEVPPQVKFLLIDTNATELANLRDFDSNEKVCIAVREPYLRYELDRKKGVSTHEFIPEKNVHSLLALERGAGQIRSNGHFAVIENQYSKKLSRVFRECADKLEDIDIDADTLEKDPKIEVRLVFSIAGGTGSGTFLPISILLRDAIQHCELTAYIYSATHFEKKVENSAKYSVMQNAYAALCELDYMMHFGRDDKRYSPITFNFGPEETQHIKQVNRPFEEVYYIDKRTSLPVPESVELAYNELDRLQDNTADAMFLAATNIITAHTGTVDNVRQKILEGQFDISDKFAWVSGQGLAEIFFNPANSDNPRVIEECLKSLKARLFGDILQDGIINNIATGFIKTYKWNETQGPYDGDPVLRSVFDCEENKLKSIIRKTVKEHGNFTVPYTEEGITLDSIMAALEGSDSQSKVNEKIKKFKDQIQKLVKALIDDDRYYKDINGVATSSLIEGYEGNGNGLNFTSIQHVLSKIEDNFKASKTQLEHEITDIDKSIGDIVSINDNSNNNVAVNQQNLQVQTNPNNAKIAIIDQKTDAIYYQTLKERTLKAIDIFDACIKIIETYKEKLSSWWDVLKKIYDSGEKRAKEINEEPEGTNIQRKTNSIEVSSLELSDGFRLTQDFIESLWKNDKEGRYADVSSMFTEVCTKFVSSRGSLQKYLANGIEQIKKLANAKEIKLEKTECQKNIERLIDLAAPTMQVDRHGYGDEVKVDQFWYIMTDCPESNIIDKPSNNGTKDDKKSVGQLLKELIEQNTLEAHVNLVHVPGWENKALFYRVKSAVPVYFVDGVCTSGIGSYTLEGCYEELKKTKRTYTPFSHEVLRQKLEHRVCALKPMDMISDSKTLDIWINFILLKFIEKRGSAGTYCIDSEKHGERYSDKLLCRNKVLVLGETRAEAYETFQRYCGELLAERKQKYDSLVENFEMSGESIENLSACDYVENKGVRCLYPEEDMNKLEKDDPDFIQLDKEIKHLEERYKNYIEHKKHKERNEAIANCDPKFCNTPKESKKDK